MKSIIEKYIEEVVMENPTIDVEELKRLYREDNEKLYDMAFQDGVVEEK